MTAVVTLWGPVAGGDVPTTTGTPSSYALDDADDAIAGVFHLPRDGTITHVGFHVDTVTGTPPDYNIGLTTITTDGDPTQTAYGGSTNTTAGSWTTGWKWIALAANATANAGDYAAVHIWPTGTAPSGSNNIAVSYGSASTTNYTARYSTSWARGTPNGLFAVKYSNGVIVGNAFSTSTIMAAYIAADTTPDEVGCVFIPPANITVNGIRIASATFGSSAVYDFVIYDDEDSVIASVTIADKDTIDDNTIINVFFDQVSLTAGSTYRVTVKPTANGTGGAFRPQRYQFESAEARAAWPFGDGSWKYTYRTNAGSWTDDELSLMFIGLWVTDLTFSTTSGGGGEFAYIG